MFWKKKEPPLSRESSLDAVVIRNQELREERSDTGVLSLYVPFRASGLTHWISNRLGGGSGEARVELDEIGAFVWDMCDGKTTIREMIDRLSERYKINRKESEVALSTFIRSLAQRRLVAVVIRK